MVTTQWRANRSVRRTHHRRGPSGDTCSLRAAPPGRQQTRSGRTGRRRRPRTRSSRMLSRRWTTWELSGPGPWSDLSSMRTTSVGRPGGPPARCSSSPRRTTVGPRLISPVSRRCSRCSPVADHQPPTTATRSMSSPAQRAVGRPSATPFQRSTWRTCWSGPPVVMRTHACGSVSRLWNRSIATGGACSPNCCG
jgi:hypothetical protein